MSSSVVMVPASTAPSSVTRSTTVLTKVMNLAVSTVGTPVITGCMSGCQDLSYSLPVHLSSYFMQVSVGISPPICCSVCYLHLIHRASALCTSSDKSNIADIT